MPDDNPTLSLRFEQWTTEGWIEQLDKEDEFNFAAIEVDDLEALTTDQYDQIYAVTSHSRNAKGKLKKKRNRLLRFTLKGQDPGEITLIESLRQWIITSYPELKRSAKIRQVQKKGGLNIEPK